MTRKITYITCMSVRGTAVCSLRGERFSYSSGGRVIGVPYYVDEYLVTWDLLLLGEVVTTDLPGGDVGTAAGLYSVLSCLSR